MIRNRLPGLLFSLAISIGAQAQKPVHLKSGDFLPQVLQTQSRLDSFMLTQSEYHGLRSFYIQFHSIPGEDARKILSSAGLSLGQYLPELTYEATSTRPHLDKALLEQAGVQTLFSLGPDRKLDAELKQAFLPARAVTIAGTVDVWISTDPAWTDQDIMAGIRLRNFDIISTQYQSYHVLALRLSQHRLSELAGLPFVRYVQATPGKDQALNRTSRAGTGGNALSAAVSDGGRGLRGEGVVVGVGDNSDVQSHYDFAGRLINRNIADVQSHGQHTTGTVGGAGNVWEHYKGYAPKSTLISAYFSNILADAPTYIQDYHMVVTNNSYGDVIDCGYHGTYDLTAAIMDQMAIQYPNLENIFAAGNSGASTCSPAPTSFHTVLGGYQSAKNTFCVAATNDSGLVASFSSRGPVKDGRIKPEISCMGANVVSSVPFNTYVSMNGTSMAAPGVSGGAVLLYQLYRQTHSGADPYNAVIKAVMMNGAVDRGLAGPDFSHGFGWMNLNRSAQAIEQNWFKIDSVAQAGNNTFTLAVPANTARLKVLLYWNDPAAAPLSAKALVNDLDLEVVDPLGNVVLPLVPDTAGASLSTVAATNRADHLNNTEQVTIQTPTAGSYTIRVKGTTIAQNPRQTYVLAYDAVPAAMELTSPMGGEAYYPGSSFFDQLRIRWEAPGIGGTADIEFSADNGTNWSTIASGVSMDRQVYSWSVPDTATNQARIRIKRNGGTEQITSGAFTIANLPTVSLAAVQCPDYITLNWTSVKGATDYEVMMLKGDEMQPVGSTTSLSYTIEGLSRDSIYLVSVRPRINGTPGLRGFGVFRQPSSGSCMGTVSDNDLEVYSLDAPVTGREFTSTQLAPSTTVKATIRNLDDVAQTGYTIAYSVNNSTWVTETSTATIAAGASVQHVFSTPVSISGPGVYVFRIAVTNANTDSHKLNDTLTRTVRYLANAQLNVTGIMMEDLETAAAATYPTDTMGLTGIERFDFNHTNVYGRARTFINTGIAHSGNRALSLDADRSVSTGVTNYLTATYNLSLYNAANNDFRIDFWYLNHGQSAHSDNKVWVRGSDQDAWIDAYDLYQNQASTGNYKKTSSIELSHLLAANGQSLSTSTQVRWGQHGGSIISNKDFLEGYTFDDIRLYQVYADLELKSIDAPQSASCGLSNATQITISVRNTQNIAASNVPVQYRVNNGGWISGTIATIPAQGTTSYTFPTTANMSAYGVYTLQAVVSGSGDSFGENDTLSIVVRNLPVISAYPYLQNFEQDSGYWYPGGKNISWEYGTPASTHINRAASGAKAWKTRLAGSYNNNELSYLYSPCFNLTGLTTPTLSFSVALDLEDCGTQLCDGAWVEYSTDGTTWIKLGANGQGYNWYNKAGANLWSIQDYTRWHVATMPLPVVSGNIRLRFVLSSDPGVTREGIAVDDIHIYDNTNGIYSGSTSPDITQTVSGAGWIDFTSGGKLVASLQPNGQSLGQTKAKAFINTGTVRNNGAQYYADRNITIKPATRDLNDSIRVRFYFLDSEADSMVFASSCPACSKPASAYELGVSKYTDADTSFENGTLSDNQQGLWSYYPNSTVSIVPFDKGYYAEFGVKSFSEFWLNNGGISGGTSLPVKLVDFKATRQGSNVLVSWDLATEDNVSYYEVQVARGDQEMQANNYHVLTQVPSLGNTTTFRHYSYLDVEPGKSGARYYRLKIVNTDGSQVYSPIRPVIFAQLNAWIFGPNPADGIASLTYQLDVQDRLDARLYDAAGRLIRRYAVQGTGGIEKLNVDLTLQASGVYLLRVKAAGEERQYRILRK